MKHPVFLYRLFLLALLPLVLSSAAGAQTVGAPIPEASAPEPVAPPVRDDSAPMTRTAQSAGRFQRQAAVDGFAEAYRSRGKPRMAVYWNDSLSQAFGRWTSDARMVQRYDSSHYGSGQSVVEFQKRARQETPFGGSDSFDWEFQDGFLGAFLEVGVTLLDRGAIVELTGLDPRNPLSSPEGRALKARADYLLEIIATASRQATTGYELRVRILDVPSGAILAMVNSRSLPDWNRSPDEIELTSEGYRLRDLDDESFGPIEERRFVAGPNGYVERRMPPRPFRVGESLAHATMSTLMQKWR